MILGHHIKSFICNMLFRKIVLTQQNKLIFLSHDSFSKWSTMTFHPGTRSKRILLDLKVTVWGVQVLLGFHI